MEKRTLIIVVLFIAAFIFGLLYLYSRPDSNFEDGLVAYKKRDFSTAIKLLSISANKENSTANVLVGEMYALGLGVPKDNIKALEHFKKANKNEALEMINSILQSLATDNVAAKNKKDHDYWKSVLLEFK